MPYSSFFEKYKDEIYDFLAGFASGTLGVIVSQPFDTIKVRLQTLSGVADGGMSAANCVKNTVHAEGPLALYKGMMAPLLMISTINAVTFASYGNALRIISSGKEDMAAGFMEVYLAGMWGGFTQSFISGPTELLKCKLQVQGKMFSSSSPIHRGNLDLMRAIIRTDGYIGMTKGLVPTLYRDVPSYGLYFAVYDYLKTFLPTIGFNELNSKLIGGAVAGSAAWTLVYPMDTVKTKIQIDTQPRLQEKPFTELVLLYRQGGIRTLYRGLGTTILRAIPTNAVVLPAYEYSLQILNAM
mmetsp:Transcript_2729/g.3889  ORF Transcript_2729/g.3889 Transcript_2729/m.3889 type:complete len:297 (-) Transcript_2729:87-977(-)